MPNHKAPSAAPSPSSRSRSSSLQRMLDLERQYMLDRMHHASSNAGANVNANANANAHASADAPNRGRPRPSNNINHNKNHSASPQLAASPASSSSSSDNQQTPWPQPLSRKPAKPTPSVTVAGGIDTSPSPSQSQAESHHPAARSSGPPQLKLDLQLPPLTIPTGEYRVPEPRRDTAPPDNKKPRQKVTAFQFPPETADDDLDLRSTCQSPSWEAYDRRKREKKERKEEEKRDREHMDKDTKDTKDAKDPKKRQVIRKQPPPDASPRTPVNQKLNQKLPPSTSSLSVSTSTLRVTPGQQKQRPASILGLPVPTPIKDDGPGRHTRSRSSSFSSLFKVSSNNRRASVDDGSRDVGFIGGVKLDQQRRAAHQKVLDDQLRASEADIHPALRRSGPDLGTNSHFDYSSAPTKDNATNRRAYPPITRQPVPNKTRQAVTGPPDESMLNKWRARVGLKPKHKAEPVAIGAPIVSASTPALLHSALDKEMGETTAPQKAAPAVAPVATQKAEVKPSNIPSPDNQQPKADDKKLRRKTLEGKPIDTQAAIPNDTGMPTSLSPPPMPPRKSSKRNSVINLHNLTPATNSSTPASTSRSSSKSPERMNDANTGDMPPVPTVVTTPSGDWRLSPANPWASSRRPVTSSDDSGSEEFHSASPSSTPDTSRPQSENCLTPICADTEKRFVLDDEPLQKPAARKSPLNSSTTTLNAHIPKVADHDDEDDPVQIAARKVMAAFPDIQPPQRPSTDRRSQSETNILRDNFLPTKFKNRSQPKAKDRRTTMPPPVAPKVEEPNSPPLRDLILTKDQSSVAAPWPATYLEAARKAAPAAATPRVAAPAVSPPNPTKNLLPPSTSSTFGSSRRPLSGLGIENPPEGGDPLAKMFVECCSCRYYHDMPSKLYAAMSDPGGMVSPGGDVGFEGAISMTVACPWCRHEMSTKCCAGLAALVYVKERLH